jgi:osmotically-inducible protein OsmY
VSINVNARVDGGVFTLEGVVDNLKAKQSAATAARNTVEAIRVKNRLKVRPVEDLIDTRIEQNVREVLSREPYLGLMKST